MEIENKVVVITGASKGIGEKLTYAFAEHKVKLALVARSINKLDDVEKNARELGATFVRVFQCDLTKLQEVNKTAHDIANTFGNVDILVNNAGIGIYKDLEDLQPGDWNQSLALNVTAPFLLIKRFLPMLKTSKIGLVVNIGSGAGKIPFSGRSVYCATKYAIRGLSLTLSKEYEGRKPDFMHIMLGSTLTEFGPMTLEEKKKKQEKGTHHYFEPKWVADKIVDIIVSGKAKDEVTLFPSDYIE
jgi:short-subunit dehydrogenase